MRDLAWSNAWRAIAPHVTPADTILAPMGEWPVSGVGEMRHYVDRIDIDDASMLILHKARLSAIPRETLARLYREWQLIYANDVFVCFARDVKANPIFRLRRYSRHARPIRDHLHSKALKRRRSTVFFVHMPKTAGTTAWNAIASSVEAKLYYDSWDSFRANPPSKEEYDLVGGHVPLSTMESAASPDDHIVCLLRNPIKRFRSAFLHSRRTDEDPLTFSPTMQRMRSMPLNDFLDHSDALWEANQQLFMLGVTPDNVASSPTDPSFFKCASQALANPNHLFMSTTNLADFVDKARALLDLPVASAPPEKLNASDFDAQLDDVAEFNACLSKLHALAAPERALYERVRAIS